LSFPETKTQTKKKKNKAKEKNKTKEGYKNRETKKLKERKHLEFLSGKNPVLKIWHFIVLTPLIKLC
jgi:hypothetical protein